MKNQRHSNHHEIHLNTLIVENFHKSPKWNFVMLNTILRNWDQKIDFHLHLILYRKLDKDLHIEINTALKPLIVEATCWFSE